MRTKTDKEIYEEKLKNISGVTLIELLIGIVITTIIMGAIYNL